MADDEGDDFEPISQRAPGSVAEGSEAEDDEDMEEDERESSDDSSDDEPLAARRARANGNTGAVAGAKRARQEGSNGTAPAKAQRTSARPTPRTSTRSATSTRTPNKPRQNKKPDDKSVKWNTLEHGGVLFPPEYTPHGVKLKYDGVPVDLTPEQEEVATMYAAMLETDYVTKKKKVFLDNFWAEFKQVLGRGHVIKSLDKCDFRGIYDHIMAEREAKKALSKEAKQALKAEKDAQEAKYKYALVDGRKEPVGNFRVEPPGLFRGRGDHPKMGKLKRRIFPSDITINIGHGAKIPEHPYEGQHWKEIRHDKSVTWLAFWKDPIDPRGYKYVWLGATSTFKTESDLAKYEKARLLKDHIGRIRADYESLFHSADVKQQQMSTALYFIDKLALRAGHEKDEDEADTVGCCTLKAENVEMIPPNRIKFDFLGKDSIRYENEVEVQDVVWTNMKTFKRKNHDGSTKAGGDQLFDAMNAQDLNVMMKDYMDGLSVKVFRTYNASVTLDELLSQETDSTDVVQKKADYDRANKEVAILCNHQRAVPKQHESSMKKMLEKIDEAQEACTYIEKDIKLVKANKPTQEGKNASLDSLYAKLKKAKEKVDKLNVSKASKEELKTVALGTSKLNYLDPRITVAWCKRNEVPIERIFNKSLLGKFGWAMEVEPEFAF